jgi:hypothetical protein
MFALQAQQGRGGGTVGVAQAFIAGGQQEVPQGPPPATDCAVSGTVVNALTGEPIPRATVSLNGGDGAGSATDATGRWSISNTTCGTRVVSASRIGFISSNSFLGQTNARTRPNVPQLVSGSPVPGVKISLMPDSSISGKVQNPDGDPVESVIVKALRVDLQNGQRRR